MCCPSWLHLRREDPIERPLRRGDGIRCGYSGPMYSARGRISRLFAYCSSTCAVQPETRLTAKIGVKSSMRNAERVIGRRRVEVDVRVQLLLGLDQRFDPLRHLEPDRLPGALPEILATSAAGASRADPRCGTRDGRSRESSPCAPAWRGRPLRLCPARRSAPISSSMRITSAFAPPCSGPFSVPIAATIAEWMSVSVAAATRAANVDAFSSWSACRISATSKARVASPLGRSPVSM